MLVTIDWIKQNTDFNSLELNAFGSTFPNGMTLEQNNLYKAANNIKINLIELATGLLTNEELIIFQNNEAFTNITFQTKRIYALNILQSTIQNIFLNKITWKQYFIDRQTIYNSYNDTLTNLWLDYRNELANTLFFFISWKTELANNLRLLATQIENKR